MSSRRLIYQNWIVKLGFDPTLKWNQVSKPTPANKRIVRTVNEALLLLDKSETDFIRDFYFQGKTYRTLSEETGRAVYRLESLHQGALSKLRRYLANRLGDDLPEDCQPKPVCPLCRHERREEIDRLIASKSRRETWRRIIRQLKEDFNIEITTPQRLIGHFKYHMSGKGGT